MDITTISNVRDLPRQYRYEVITGELEACKARYIAKYPWLQGQGTGYYLPAGVARAGMLCVAAEWNREQDERKA